MSDSDLADSLPSGSARGTKTKRQRLQNSCDNCKKRKIRCDSAARGGTACSQCVSLNVECLHTAERKKRGPPAGRSAQLKSASIQALTASILSSVPYSIPQDEMELRRILKQLASYIRTLESELAASRKSDLGTSVHSREESSEPATSREEYDETDELSEQLKQLHFNHSHERYHGKLSYRLQFIKSALDTDQPFNQEAIHICKRPIFWEIQPWQFTRGPRLEPLVFPPQDLLVELVDIWFAKSNPFFPLLHRPLLEQSIASGLHYHDRDFGEALLAMCALASRHSDDPRNCLYGSQLSAGFVWMHQVNPVPASFTEVPSLFQLQKLVLYIMFMQSTSTPYSGWVLAGLGIRLLQDVGAHRKQASPPSMSRELWKRAFWILVYMDSAWSVNMGRPRAITSDNYDVEFPVEVDDVYWEQPGELAFKQPPGKPCQLAYWIQILKLISILESLQRAMRFVRSSLRKPDPDVLAQRQRALIEIDKALDNWLEATPEHLKWNPHRPDSLVFDQSTSLYLMYFYLRIETHRHSITRPGSTFSSSLETCLNAAHSCVLIMEARRKREYVVLGPQMLAAIANSAIMLLINIWRSKQLNVEIDIEAEMVDVVRCMNQLERFEKRIQVAGRLWDTVLNIISISNLTDAYNNARETCSTGTEATTIINVDPDLGAAASSAIPPPNQSCTLEQYLQGYGSSLPSIQVIPTDKSIVPTAFATPDLQHLLSFGSNLLSINAPFLSSSASDACSSALQSELDDALQPSGTLDNMDVSGGDWAQYMTSVDEVLRALQQA
ncbi:hypothetical protein BT96DRAFT_872143 [Gymnopus androsaceus JB14]|uniref:Zn(2)-C6 fungal-type domain-containing protein n=1 Tax=Gymnopus androsaceus JB14 TaxID=1447944 RepID=A0A6A4IKS3_9AGAR|nr:hypothetical protein BT96DRAFT_872143 [Gymnopus androsaceus JB14]